MYTSRIIILRFENRCKYPILEKKKKKKKKKKLIKFVNIFFLEKNKIVKEEVCTVYKKRVLPKEDIL
jgi:hypothetical protein